MKPKTVTIVLVSIFIFASTLAADTRKNTTDVKARTVTKTPVKERAIGTTRNMTICPLPEKNGKIDSVKVLTESFKIKTSTLLLIEQEQKRISRIIKKLKTNDYDSAKKDFGTLLQDLSKKSEPVDVMGLLFYIVRESVSEQNKDMEDFLSRLASYNEIAENLGDYLGDLQDAFEAAEENDCDDVKESLEEKIKKREKALAEIESDAQLINTELQNMLQKQQHTIQTLSNISKTLHDTATGTIRKIG